MAVSTAERYAALAQRLETELAQALEGIAASGRDIRDLSQDVIDEGTLSAPADGGADVSDIERQQVVKANLEALVEQIRAAQARMAAGTYGICTNCGKQIPLERLEALPWASLCIDCQAAAER